MPSYNPAHNQTYWSERALLSVASEAGSMDVNGELSELGLGRFLKGLMDMRKDEKGGTNARGEHPAYVSNKASRHAMRELIENIVHDLVSSF